MQTLPITNNGDTAAVNEQTGTANPVLKFLAKLVSYVFHPCFVPVYVVLFLVYEHPNMFVGFSSKNKILVVAQAFMMFTFFPIITTLLLKALKFIDSIQLPTQRDRIIPLIASMTWYFWIWHVWRNLADYPKELVALALGVFVASIIAMLANIKFKISLHAIAVGTMITFLVTIALQQSLHFAVYLSVAFIIAGLVCTARLLSGNHNTFEVYSGFLAGVGAQLIANFVALS
jgi:hypothetical protein